MRKILTALAALFSVLMLAPAPAAAQSEVIIRGGNVAPLPIAAPAFSGPGPHGADLAQIIRDNLGRSGAFAPIEPSRYVEQNVNGSAVPAFPNWKLIGSQFLVTGVTSADAGGAMRVEFRLWDVNTERQLLSWQLSGPEASWRRMGHQISDDIYELLTGRKGYFDTRIAFVAESGPRTQRRRVLTLMDQDGANAQYLTGGEAQIFTPRFSADGKTLVYMSLRDEGSQLLLWNLDTNRQESLGVFEGMAFAPRFSPEGGRIAFSMSRYGNTDIFIANARAGGYSRLTSDPGIDTSPSFSPDGARIAFNSDRAGSPQLYLMNADGSGQRRLSTGGGRYTTPVWSPDGQWIAFTKQDGNVFHIGVMRPDGGGERILTTSYLDEGPTWAPNSQVLMFFRETRGGGSRLWMVDLNGREQAAPFPGAGSDPAWSPLLE